MANRKAMVILIVVASIFVCGLGLPFYLKTLRQFNPQPSPSTPGTKAVNPDPTCISRIDLGDLSGDGKPELLQNCKDRIGILISGGVPQEEIYFSELETAESFPWLFRTDFESDNLPNSYLEREIKVFPKIKPRFMAIQSDYETPSQYLHPFSIYEIKNSKAYKVFKYDIEDIKGRFIRAETLILSNSDISFEIILDINDLQYNGVDGSGRAVETGGWKTITEKYKWSEKENTFVKDISNTKLYK